MFRLLGLLGGLSVAMDLGVGAPLEESMKRCLVAVRLARSVGCADDEVQTVLYSSLLQHLGCTAAAHELAGALGDDIAATRQVFLTNPVGTVDTISRYVPALAAATGRSRARTLWALARAGRTFDRDATTATCEVAREAAGLIGLPPDVAQCLFLANGSGEGSGSTAPSGEDLPRPARILRVAAAATAVFLHAGESAVAAELRRLAGAGLDPALVDALPADALARLPEVDAFVEVLDAEPQPVLWADGPAVERVVGVFGDLVDLKSPWLLGHSAAVAGLSAAAAGALGLDPGEARVAGHAHDLGRIAVSSGIWDKDRPLTAGERAQVELHAYHSEQILARVPQLTHLAAVAGRHHERLDGSGYHRGLHAERLTLPMRLLAAADRYCTLVEARPHRPAATPRAAARTLRDEVAAGLIDRDAAQAVLVAAGQRPGGRPVRPAGLTARQIQVLRQLAVGRSNAEIARELVISRRTAEHHVQDIYTAIGASSRAAAALYAVQHGLMGPADM